MHFLSLSPKQVLSFSDARGRSRLEILAGMVRRPRSGEIPQEQTEGETETETLTKSMLNHKVVLFNDEEHTYDYVVELLTQVCRLSRDNAFRCAVEVDMTGRTIVHYGERSECERMCSKIRSYGPDHRLPQSMGSMQAEVQSV
jgi:ATP-dependent Clp protease adaptor protein ClpS